MIVGAFFSGVERCVLFECRYSIPCMQANLVMQQDVKTLTLSPQCCASVVQAIIKRHRTTTICLPTYNEGDERCPALRLSTCSRVSSQAGLKTVSASSTPKDRENDKGKAKVVRTGTSNAELELCPQCGKKYYRIEDVVLLDSPQEEEDAMREAMASKRLLEPVKMPKLSNKQKNESPTDDAEYPARKRSGGAEHEDICGESGGVFTKLIPP